MRNNEPGADDRSGLFTLGMTMTTDMTEYTDLDRDELIRILRERDQQESNPHGMTERQMEDLNGSSGAFQGTLAGGRTIVARRLNVTQQDAIQLAVADAYRDRPHQVTFQITREQYMTSLVQVGNLRLGGSVTQQELWESLGRNRSQYMQMWALLHDTTEQEDRDFFATIRPMESSSMG